MQSTVPHRQVTLSDMEWWTTLLAVLGGLLLVWALLVAVPLVVAA